MGAAVVLGVAGILSLIVVLVAEGLFKREAPFGKVADYVIGLIAGVGWGALDYFVLVQAILGPDTAEWVRISAAVIEGPLVAWLVLWALRQIIRPPAKAG
jgi:hypothetical protein